VGTFADLHGIWLKESLFDPNPRPSATYHWKYRILDQYGKDKRFTGKRPEPSSLPGDK